MSKESFYPLILLLIPLFIMNITDEVNWSLLDFFIMGFMIVLLGFIINSISSKTKNLKKRIIYIGIIILNFFIIWAEMAVGIFNTPFAGN